MRAGFCMRVKQVNTGARGMERKWNCLYTSERTAGDHRAVAHKFRGITYMVGYALPVLWKVRNFCLESSRDRSAEECICYITLVGEIQLRGFRGWHQSFGCFSPRE